MRVDIDPAFSSEVEEYGTARLVVRSLNKVTLLEGAFVVRLIATLMWEMVDLAQLAVCEAIDRGYSYKLIKIICRVRCSRLSSIEGARRYAPPDCWMSESWRVCKRQSDKAGPEEYREKLHDFMRMVECSIRRVRD